MEDPSTEMWISSKTNPDLEKLLKGLVKPHVDELLFDFGLDFHYENEGKKFLLMIDYDKTIAMPGNKNVKPGKITSTNHYTRLHLKPVPEDCVRKNYELALIEGRAASIVEDIIEGRRIKRRKKSDESMKTPVMEVDAYIPGKEIPVMIYSFTLNYFVLFTLKAREE